MLLLIQEKRCHPQRNRSLATPSMLRQCLGGAARSICRGACPRGKPGCGFSSAKQQCSVSIRELGIARQLSALSLSCSQSLSPSCGRGHATHARTAAKDTSPPPPPPPPRPSSKLPSNLQISPKLLKSFKAEIEDRKAQQKLDTILPPALMEMKVMDMFEWAETEHAVTLEPSVFAAPLRRDIVHQVVVWQRAKLRKGLAKTKRVGEIRGSTKKARPQKRQGRARAGKKRAPQFRGGYKPHGPVKRDFSFKLNKKVRAFGLRVVLSAKAAEKNLIVVDSLALPEPKTRIVDAILQKHDDWGRTLFIDGVEVDKNFELAVRNISDAHILPYMGANCYDIISAETLVLSRSAVEALNAWLRPDRLQIGPRTRE